VVYKKYKFTFSDELLASYCNFADYIVSNVLGLGMQQLSCIGLGDKNCIECMKQGRRTEMPSNLKKIICKKY